jgi:hypothetical protein
MTTLEFVTPEITSEDKKISGHDFFIITKDDNEYLCAIAQTGGGPAQILVFDKANNDSYLFNRANDKSFLTKLKYDASMLLEHFGNGATLKPVDVKIVVTKK